MIRNSRRVVTIMCVVSWLSTSGCQPDESPFKAESENLRKQMTKQESVVTSLQEGNKVMQQQIDLLNHELRDAKKDAEKAQADAKILTQQLESQLVQTKKLTAEVQRTAATKAQASETLHVEDKGSQTEELPRPLAVVSKAVEEALARNGYRVRVSVKTDQKAIYVTERKVSSPASLEVSGFRNQYVVSLQALPSNVTRLSVKAEFEKLAQGNRVLPISPDETSEIERRLIGEINKTLAAPAKA